jgi:hypothetical protein
MKRWFLTACIAICSSSFTYSQMVVEDAKGQSSILYRNSNISLNLTEASLSTAINNFRKIHIAKKPTQLLWQLSATGKNEEGLAILWNEGNLKAAARIEGSLGVRFNGHKKEYRIYEQIDKLTNDSIQADYFSAITNIIYSDITLTYAQKKTIIDTLKYISENQNYELYKVISDLKALSNSYTANDPAELKLAVNNIIKNLKNRITNINKIEDSVNNVLGNIMYLNEQLDEFRKSHAKRIFTVFLNFGMNASNYILYNQPSFTPFSSRFDTAQYRGGFIDLGLNYDFGPNWVIGAGVGYEKSNTFDSLSKSDYAERTSETNGQQQFTSEKKYTAFSGQYKSYDRATIKTDILYFGKISNEFRFVWNLIYTRWYLPINQKDIKGIGNIGTGFNFYKENGNFAGGIYLEETDLFNNLSDDNSSFFRRLTFGITTKFSFSSIFDR